MHLTDPPCALADVTLPRQLGHIYIVCGGPGFVSMSPASVSSRGMTAGEFSLPINEKKKIFVLVGLLILCVLRGLYLVCRM